MKNTPIFSGNDKMNLKFKKTKNKIYSPKVIIILLVVASNTPTRILLEFLKNIQNCLF